MGEAGTVTPRASAASMAPLTMMQVLGTLLADVADAQNVNHKQPLGGALGFGTYLI